MYLISINELVGNPNPLLSMFFIKKYHIILNFEMDTRYKSSKGLIIKKRLGKIYPLFPVWLQIMKEENLKSKHKEKNICNFSLLGFMEKSKDTF